MYPFIWIDGKKDEWKDWWNNSWTTSEMHQWHHPLEWIWITTDLEFCFNFILMNFNFILKVKSPPRGKQKNNNNFWFVIAELTLNSNSGDVVCCSHIWSGYMPANVSNIAIACHLLMSDTHFQLTNTPGGSITWICCYSVAAGNTPLGRSSKKLPLSSSSS